MSNAMNAIVVTSPITDRHTEIGKQMLEQVTAKIVDAILHGTMKITAYKVQDNYSVCEDISVVLADKTIVGISITHPSR